MVRAFRWTAIPAVALALAFGCHAETDTSAPATWTATQIPLLESLTLQSLADPPADPGNRWGEDPAAAALGEKLFFDADLTGNGISCSSCHVPDRGFTDGRPTSKGLAVVRRNAPSLLDVAYRRWFFWDGRSDSLWSQALETLESPTEMGGSRGQIVRRVDGDPELSELYREAFDATAREHEVEHAFANLGKALAAYQRRLRSEPTRFDAYVAAISAKENARAAALLDDAEVEGLRLFIGRSGCVSCHLGPFFSDGSFHNVGTGRDPETGAYDPGRAVGSQALLTGEFNCRSAQSDARDSACWHLDTATAAEVPSLQRGAFKTPGLRGLAATAPYMHDGRFASLAEVLAFYADPPDKAAIPHELPGSPGLSPRDLRSLEAFLNTL